MPEKEAARLRAENKEYRKLLTLALRRMPTADPLRVRIEEVLKREVA